MRLADRVADLPVKGRKVKPPVARQQGVDLDSRIEAVTADLPSMGVAERVHAMRGPQPRTESSSLTLSAREREALQLLAESLTYKQIARQQGISTSTVRTHLHNIYRKLGVVDRVQAVLKAIDMGYIAGAVSNGRPTETQQETRERLKAMDQMPPRPRPFLPDPEADPLDRERASDRRPHEGVLADVLIVLNLKDVEGTQESVLAAVQEVMAPLATKDKRDAVVRLAAEAMHFAAKIDHVRLRS